MIKSIKQQAQALLKDLPGKYALFAVPIILTIINMTVSYRESNLQNFNEEEVSFGATIFPSLVVFLLAFITISALITILEVVRKERKEVTFGDIGRSFSGELFGKLFLLLFIRLILLMLWGIPMFIGTVTFLVGGALLWNMELSAAPGTALVVFGVMISLGGLLLLIYKNTQYGQAEFILYDQVKQDHYQGPLNIIKQSKALMKGHVWENIVLYLSFIGWYLLVLPTLGLIYIHLLPYITTTRSLYYQYLLEQNGQVGPFDQTPEVSAVTPS
ncbi:DUF975 family protein [Streptococcus pluranimalium]